MALLYESLLNLCMALLENELAELMLASNEFILVLTSESVYKSLPGRLDPHGALSVPVVYWTARAVMGYRHGAGLWIAALYGFSPITWYAVYHVATGQLLAAPAIALITWAGVALWRGPLNGPSSTFSFWQKDCGCANRAARSTTWTWSAGRTRSPCSARSPR